MADNYLEKKMEAFREGKQVIRRQGASVESLLKILAEDAAGEAGEPLKEPAVMPAQLEAVLRAGRMVEGSEAFRYETDESAALIRVLGPSSPRKYMVVLGEVLLAMRLKAAELHLCSSVSLRPESTVSANPLLATVNIWK